MGEVATMLRRDYGITKKPITTRNPQANAMVERAHATIHNLVRTRRVRGKEDVKDGWDGVLGAVAFAMRSTVHTTNRATPMQLAFARDAIHNTRFEADWNYMRSRKARLIRQNNERENAKRTPHTFSVGDQVMIIADPSRKHGSDVHTGPYRIASVYDNGTVRLEQRTLRGGVVYQTWNIRKLIPYRA